jgi:hypothetical protein
VTPDLAGRGSAGRRRGEAGPSAADVLFDVEARALRYEE